MATEASILQRVRQELGDLPERFRQTFRGTGTQDEFDLPGSRISATDLRLYTVDGQGQDTTLTSADYTLDADNGVVRLSSPLATDVLLVVEGTAFGMFTDDDLAQYVRDAVLQHTNGQGDTVRYRDGNGFIRYDRTAKAIGNLDEIEELPVALLATITALYALLTDASTDIDVTTSEGTHIPRSQRFGQIMQTIEAVNARYQYLCAMLNVGLGKIEVSNLRRVSRTTGRLVPIFVEREYDETSLPTRVLPEIDQRDADPDGPPSQAFGQGIW